MNFPITSWNSVCAVTVRGSKKGPSSWPAIEARPSHPPTGALSKKSGSTPLRPALSRRHQLVECRLRDGGVGTALGPEIAKVTVPRWELLRCAAQKVPRWEPQSVSSLDCSQYPSSSGSRRRELYTADLTLPPTIIVARCRSVCSLAAVSAIGSFLRTLATRNTAGRATRALCARRDCGA